MEFIFFVRTTGVTRSPPLEHGEVSQLQNDDKLTANYNDIKQTALIFLSQIGIFQLKFKHTSKETQQLPNTLIIQSEVASHSLNK
jgi:hypothetical protein